METPNSKGLAEPYTQARPGMQVPRMTATHLGQGQLMACVAWGRDCGSGGVAEGRAGSCGQEA